MNTTKIKLIVRVASCILLLVITVPLLFSQDIPDDFIYQFGDSDSLTVSVVGDIMLHDLQLASAWDEETGQFDFNPMFSRIQNLLSRSDITLGNLETTLPGKKELYSGYPKFGSPDAIVMALKNAGIDLLNTANNHTCDKGRLGLVRTIQVLDSLGLFHVGTYRDTASYHSRRVLIVEQNHFRIGFLSYTYYLNGNPVPEGTIVNRIERDRMASDIALARSFRPDCIIVMIHFGIEYRRSPDAFQIETVEFLFDQGVDIVLGSHPHVLQPFELKTVTDKYGAAKLRLVVYSLGNFLSNQRERYRDGGIIFNFTLKKKGLTALDIQNIRFVPTWVYVQTKPDQRKFTILPVADYLNNDQPLELPQSAYAQMMTFYRDTMEWLERQNPPFLQKETRVYP